VSAQTTKDSNWKLESCKVLRSERIDGKNRMDLRVVKWERAEKPVLEKRRIWEKEDGERPMKVVGLNADDVRFIYENYPEIINLL
jgi:hypothetical protein